MEGISELHIANKTPVSNNEIMSLYMALGTNLGIHRKVSYTLQPSTQQQ